MTAKSGQHGRLSAIPQGSAATLAPLENSEATVESAALAEPGKPTDKGGRRAAECMDFTKTRLDDLLRSGRPHRQKMIWDTKERGLSVLISRGPKDKRQATVTFRVVYYLKDSPGKPRYFKLGRYPDDYPDFKISAVRDKAALIRSQARQNGIDPRRKPLSGNLKEVVDRFIDEHATGNRTCGEATRILNRYVVPEWADKQIESITKTDVTELLNKVARGQIAYIDKYGKSRKAGTPAMARAVRAQLQTLFNWYVDEYGGDMGAYGAAVRSALLTAQRFRKVGQMHRDDIKDRIRIQGHMEDGEWIEDYDIGHVWDATRPDDPKNKRVSVVPLAPLARTILSEVPIIDVRNGKDFVFTTTGVGPLKGWSKYKARLDGKMLALLRQWAGQRGHDPEQVALEPWQHRDLRRTARTLMSRMHIDSKVAEHCLAHSPPGVEGIYDRYSYLPQKRDAFEKLADLVERIVSPPEDNVARLDEHRLASNAKSREHGPRP